MSDAGRIETDAPGEGALSQGSEQRVLPAANDFSPGIVKLRDLLQLLADTPGDRNAQAEQIRLAYFANKVEKRTDPAGRLKQQLQLSRNVLIGVENYRLYDKDTAILTPFGQELLAMDEVARNAAFARHILTQLHGLEVLRIIHTMQRADRAVDKASLAEELNRHGFVTTLGGPIPTNTVNHLRMIAWLREAKVVSAKGYVIDEMVVKTLVGAAIADLEDAAELTDPQKIFLQVIRRDFDVNGARDMFVRDVLTLCKATAPTLFARTDNLKRAVVEPLVQGGWLGHVTKSGEGRGGDSGRVHPLDRLQTVAPEYLGIGSIAGIPAEVRSRLNKPLAQIFEELDSANTGVKGLALETLAVRLLYEVGLTPIAFRERGAENDGAEVDLIAEGHDLHFHRWMVQCKNTKSVSVGALAKEVGMAVLYRAQVVLIVTTGRFTATVHVHAKELAETNSLQAVLIDGAALADYRKRGALGLIPHFQRLAEKTRDWKRPQLRDDRTAAASTDSAG